MRYWIIILCHTFQIHGFTNVGAMFTRVLISLFIVYIVKKSQLFKFLLSHKYCKTYFVFKGHILQLVFTGRKIIIYICVSHKSNLLQNIIVVKCSYVK